MSKSSFTPGPWIVTDDVNAHVIRGAEEPKVQGDIQFVFRDYVCSMWGGYHEANARLISQAPAMLEALYEQYAFLADITHNWEGRHTTAGQARLIALRDLIVQATGRDEMEVQDEASMPRAAKGGA